MPKFREHKGSLYKSMKTCMEFQTLTELANYYRKELKRYDFKCLISQATLHQSPYVIDSWMPGWENQHIITLDGYGVLGFSSDKLEEKPYVHFGEVYEIEGKEYVIESATCDGPPHFKKGTMVNPVVHIPTPLGVSREVCIAIIEAFEAGYKKGSEAKTNKMISCLKNC